ncbi:MAG: laccase domain-containing protein [Candidatus Obscuribacter sp.]|nr:laccase domain-containing protein [Candidatus Obscuribacter sp.]
MHLPPATGGECPSPYNNFNLGRSVGDDTVKAFALKNRQRLLKALALDHDILQVPGQVHSGNVVKVHHGAAKQDLSGVDGLATTDKHLPVLLHFADCVPVLVYERDKGLLAIVHAGWRGTAQSIAGRAVEVLQSLGGDPSHMVAAVGQPSVPAAIPLEMTWWLVSWPLLSAKTRAKLSSLSRLLSTTVTARISKPSMPCSFCSAVSQVWT